MPDPLGGRPTLSDRVGAATDLPHSGYDHPWFPWRPASARPAVTFPGGARTAVGVVVALSAPEWEDGDPAPRPAAPGGRGVGPPPDVPRQSHREFGHRVGALRLLDQLTAAGVAPAVAVDVLTAERYRPLLDLVLPGCSEVLAGGLSASRPITSAMSEDEERDYIEVSLDRLTAALGDRPRGWAGPEHAESDRTPRLLAESRVDYVTDWDNDDLPYPMPGAGLWSFPLSWDLSDLACAFHRQMSPWTWADAVVEAFDVLHAEGGRMLTLHLQPWLSGQAFRAESVERVLDHLTSSPGVWVAPPGRIVAAVRDQLGDEPSGGAGA